MTLLQAAAEATETIEPFSFGDISTYPWYGQLLAAVLGVAVAVAVYKLTGKALAKKAKDATAAILLVGAILTLSGCAGAAQKAAIRDSINALEPVIHDLEGRANAAESERKANQKHIDSIKDAAK